MVMFSSQISQQMYMSQLSMSQQMQQAQMLSMQMGLMPMSPAMPQMNIASAMSNVGTGGIYGEQVSQRIVGATQFAGTMGTLGLGIMGGMSGLPFDPFSAAWKFGKAGYAAAGIGGAAMGAIGGALPFMAAGQVIGAYTGAFTGGMREQAATNAMLRQNFNFLGGQGAFGRGFSQQQMGQIGGMLSQEAQRTPYTSSAELNQLIQGGQDMGMFNAVRDVESFSRRFKTMLDGLRKIQKELGGTLGEALAFTRGTQQLGIFTTGGRTQFASEMRDTMSVTGMNQNEIFSLAATGSMLSRATGGLGRQGAMGAMRMARQLGSALSTGAINQELLSEATGGLQGDQAIQAMTGRIMQMSDRFSRSSAGRYSLFSLSNEAGTGLDAGMLARFRSGDISVGDIMRGAHTNVNRMGRARALNQEGQLRGALMEEGGLSAQLGIMRLRLGERALSGSDDLAQLYMQRRMGIGQSEAQLFTSLLRNQGSIAAGEDIESTIGKRGLEEQRDLKMNRSVDAFLTQFGHGMAEVSGTNKAKEMGRNFLTRVSSTIERAINDVVGATASSLTSEDRRAIARIATGRGTSEDVMRMSMSQGDITAGRVADPFAVSSANALLRSMGMHGGQTLGEVAQARGVNLRGMTPQQQDAFVREMELAQQGKVSERNRVQVNALKAGGADTVSRIAEAYSAGGRNRVYEAFGVKHGGISAFAIDAAAHDLGLDLGEIDYMRPGQRQGGIENNLGYIIQMSGARAAERGMMGAAAGATMVGLATAGVGAGGGFMLGGTLGAIWGGIEGAYGAIEEVTKTDQDRAMEYLAKGGDAYRYALKAGRNEAIMTSEQATNLHLINKGKAWYDFSTKGEVTGEVMQKVLGSDQVHMALKRIEQSDGKALAEELAALRSYGMTLPEEEQKAITNIVANAQMDMTVNKRLGPTLRAAVHKKDRDEAAMAQYRDYGKDYTVLMDKVTDRTLRLALGQAASSAYGYDTQELNLSTTAVVRRLSEMSEEELMQAQEELGGAATGRSLLMEGSRRHGLVREIAGEGRRGRAGAADALFGELTGHTLGDIDLKLGNRTLGKRNQAQVLLQEISRGGANADALVKQLGSKLKGAGVKRADEYLADITAGVTTGDKKLDKTEINDLLDKLHKDTDIQRLGKEAVAAKQRANDPLGAERLDVLKQIRTGIGILANADLENNKSDGSPPTAQKGS